MAEHRYTAQLVWEGSTGAGYRVYPRTHRASAPPAKDTLALSADPQFRGDADLLNPEQLVVMAASSCQLLSFLAVAARHHLDVLEYRDDALGVMTKEGGPERIGVITLAPTVRVAPGTDHDQVVRLLHQAHEECYIANTLNSEIVLRPSVVSE